MFWKEHKYAPCIYAYKFIMCVCVSAKSCINDYNSVCYTTYLYSTHKYWTRLFAFHIALKALGKGMNPTILFPAMGK